MRNARVVGGGESFGNLDGGVEDGLETLRIGLVEMLTPCPAIDPFCDDKTGLVCLADLEDG